MHIENDGVKPYLNCSFKIAIRIAIHALAN